MRVTIWTFWRTISTVTQQTSKWYRKSHAAFYMSGNGGNKILGFPDPDMAVAITSTNYNTHGMHEQTGKLLTDYILPAVAQ